MKRIFAAIVAISVMGISVFAQTSSNQGKTEREETRTEILKGLTSLPGVSVTYLTKSMLQRLPKDKAESPLGMLVREGGVESVRLFELGNDEAEAAGKKLAYSYLSESKGREPELLMMRNDGSSEIQLYGLTFINDINYYYRIILFSKPRGKKANLIIMTGRIPENIVGQMLDSFSE